MKNRIITLVVASVLSTPALAIDGLRLGGGFNTGEIDGEALDTGFKLEVGYDLDRVFGLYGSIGFLDKEEKGGSRKATLDVRMIDVGSDIGYVFDLQGSQIKPYAAISITSMNVEGKLICGNYTCEQDDYTKTAVNFGFGFRWWQQNLYFDGRFDSKATKNEDLDTLSFTLGYRF